MNIKGLMFYVDSKEEINTTNEEIYASSKRKEIVMDGLTRDQSADLGSSHSSVHASTEDSIVT